MLDGRMEESAWRRQTQPTTMTVVGGAFAVALKGERGVTVGAVLDDAGRVGEVGLGGSDTNFDFRFLICDLVGRGDALRGRYNRFPLTPSLSLGERVIGWG